MKQPGTRLEKM